MSQLIVLIQPGRNEVKFQINQHDKLETFNLTLDCRTGYAEFTDFLLPSMCIDMSIHGSRYLDTMNKVVKTIPALVEQSKDIAQFIVLLAKKFKVKAYQVNVNSCFDDSMVKPFNVSAVFDIVENFKRFDLATSL